MVSPCASGSAVSAYARLRTASGTKASRGTVAMVSSTRASSTSQGRTCCSTMVSRARAKSMFMRRKIRCGEPAILAAAPVAMIGSVAVLAHRHAVPEVTGTHRRSRAAFSGGHRRAGTSRPPRRRARPACRLAPAAAIAEHRLRMCGSPLSRVKNCAAARSTSSMSSSPAGNAPLQQFGERLLHALRPGFPEHRRAWRWWRPAASTGCGGRRSLPASSPSRRTPCRSRSGVRAAASPGSARTGWSACPASQCARTASANRLSLSPKWL